MKHLIEVTVLEYPNCIIVSTRFPDGREIVFKMLAAHCTSPAESFEQIATLHRDHAVREGRRFSHRKFDDMGGVLALDKFAPVKRQTRRALQQRNRRPITL